MSRVNVTDHHERLSLPFLRELSLKNLNHIDDLYDLLTVKSMSSYILTLVTVIPLCVVIGILYRRLNAKAPEQNAGTAKGKENGQQPPIAPPRAPPITMTPPAGNTTTPTKPGARLYQSPLRRSNQRTPPPDREQRSTRSKRLSGANPQKTTPAMKPRNTNPTDPGAPRSPPTPTRSDTYTDTESETSYDSSTDSGDESATDSEDEETPETRRYDPPPPYSRQCPPGSITLQGGPSELPSYQQSQRGTLPRAPWTPALSYSPMGCRFHDYSRSSDAITDFHGGITTDEGDSSDEDISRPRTATPNEEPGANEPMETDDGAETTLRHTPTPEVPELFTSEEVTRWTVAPPDWVTNTADRTLPTPLVQEILRRLEPQGRTLFDSWWFEQRYRTHRRTPHARVFVTLVGEERGGCNEPKRVRYNASPNAQ
ncbi:GL10072 [Drosophila persimilis]|uniref:GL10072 n=1 Tax=Drosophila persimilis TaxID=7234 RepID=B4HCC4_DROPE|nr:GL10072 [Drosophila persimilis]